MASVSTSALMDNVGNFEVEGKDRPPFNLDEYVDWSTRHSCGSNLGVYQIKVLWVLTTCWGLTAVNTYSWNFITKEPDVGEISGRRLILPDGVVSCNQSQIDMYGDACPELPFDFCGIDRDLWEYREPENSVRAYFDLSECTPRKFVIATIGSFWWLCYGIGVATSGVFSDKFGRQAAWYVYLAIQTVGAVLMPLSTSYVMLGASRMFQAVGAGGFGVIGFVYFTEALNPESRHYIAWVPNIWFIAGASLPAIMTYGVALYDWRSYQWFVAVSNIPWFLVPLMFFESPKWLAATGKRAKIHEVMSGICTQNGRPAPPPPPESDYVKTASKLDVGLNEQQWEQRSQDEGFGALAHPKVLGRLTVTGLTWLTLVMTYYGLSFFDPPDLFDHPVFSFMTANTRKMISWIFGFVLEIPASVASAWMIEQPSIGRKGVGGGCYVLGAAILGVAALKPISPDWLWLNYTYTGCYYVARMFIAAAFGVVYVWSAELFPNSIRNTTMGINSACARIGSSLSPWTGEINNFSVKMLVFAIPGMIVGALAMFTLPETRGRTLPGYIADMED